MYFSHCFSLPSEGDIPVDDFQRDLIRIVFQGLYSCIRGKVLLVMEIVEGG